MPTLAEPSDVVSVEASQLRPSTDTCDDSRDQPEACLARRDHKSVSMYKCEVSQLLAVRIEYGPEISLLMPEQFDTIEDGVLESCMLGAVSCFLSRLGLANQHGATFELLDHALSAQENQAIVAGFVLLFDSRFFETTERHEVPCDRSGMVLLAFSGESAEELVQCITTYLLSMRLALSGQTLRL